MTRRDRYNSEFGASVSQALAEANINQADLATSAGVSPSYLNQMMTGRKKASPEWVDIVSRTLKLRDAARKQLHKAAAKDAGYDIDLTKE